MEPKAEDIAAQAKPIGIMGPHMAISDIGHLIICKVFGFTS